MNILEKIQKLPVFQKKIILWTIMIFFAIFFIWLWSKSFSKNWQVFKSSGLSEEFKIPDLKQKIEKDLPKIEIPSNLQDFNKNFLTE